jgi:hypothetical protein
MFRELRLVRGMRVEVGEELRQEVGGTAGGAASAWGEAFCV